MAGKPPPCAVLQEEPARSGASRRLPPFQSTNVCLLLCNSHTCRVQTLTDRQLRQHISRMSNGDKLLSLAKVRFCTFLARFLNATWCTAHASTRLPV